MRPVTIAQKLGLAYLSGKGMAHGVEAIGNGETVEGISSVLLGALGVAGALSMRWNCFTAGHQILALPLGVTVADAALGTSDETSGWRTEYLIGAGVAIAVGITGWARERRKRRRLLAQARDHVYGCQWESNSRHELDDDHGPLREAIAMDHAEATIWSDESFLPDADSFHEPAAVFVASDAEHSHGVACLPPPQTVQSIHLRRATKPSAAPRESRRGGLWLGLSLVVAFFCLFQALPRWSRTDGLTSAGTQHGIASASFDTNIIADYRVGGESYQLFKIEDIRPGQLVLASNPATGQLEPR